MQRTYKKQLLGDRGVRHIVRLTDDVGLDRDLRRMAFLKELIDNHAAGTLQCGPCEFDTMTIHHTGQYWEAVLVGETTE